MGISACEKGHKPQQALHLLQELQLRGLLPNVITYSAAISACEKGQKPQQALHLLQDLQLRGLLPDVNYLQRGHQRLRERPKATTGIASVARDAAPRPLSKCD